MQPMIFEETIIIDGGVGYNYPIALCKEENIDEEKNILGIRMRKIKDATDYKNIGLIKYVLKIIEKMKDKLNKINESSANKEIAISCESFVKTFSESLVSKDKRNELWEMGNNAVKIYLEDSIEKVN